MGKNKKIDVCGLSCPQPALRTKEALNSMTEGTVEVLTDSTTARDNVVRTAEKAGWAVTIQDQPDGCFQLRLTK
jgi:TusA-related sulfurtransferase